jgi:hypothetical protein
MDDSGGWTGLISDVIVKECDQTKGDLYNILMPNLSIDQTSTDRLAIQKLADYARDPARCNQNLSHALV